jgi:hypothetical protein
VLVGYFGFIGYLESTMASSLFPVFDLTVKQVELITQVYENLRPRHPEAEFDFDYQPPLEQYEAIRGNYFNFKCGPVLRVENGPTSKYLSFIHVDWKDAGGRYGANWYADFQTWGIASLARSYGHVLIRPETTLDKIRELIHHAEIDFEDDKEFSRQFYVLANEEDGARKLLGSGLRQTIAELGLKDFMIEVVDRVMIVGDNKSADPTTAGEMANFLCGLSPLL